MKNDPTISPAVRTAEKQISWTPALFGQFDWVAKDIRLRLLDAVGELSYQTAQAHPFCGRKGDFISYFMQ